MRLEIPERAQLLNSKLLTVHLNPTKSLPRQFRFSGMHAKVIAEPGNSTFKTL